ncbi:hypothetical protein DXG03_004632 [Asterophora parasitica]|uniref:YTH domain-containing protein n=1 Tax=Asterophora parasitica TaxID=117018 RepID=A0A9P7GEU7_9AGAR|nr:hypothetical protein DXG03_004632 [Asterophora parasitica]
MNIDHNPPPFSYPHPYHHPGIPDNNIMIQTMHANYPSMLQPPAPAFPYQSHSPESPSNANHAFPNAESPTIYNHHQGNTSPPLHSPPPANSPGPSGSHMPYSARGAFHSLNYPSPLPAYGYPPPQVYSASQPMYSQYAHTPYAQQFAPSLDTERQGTWWYMPHAAAAVPPQQQVDSGSASYQSHYHMPYVHHEAEVYSPRAPSPPTNSSAYPPMSPIRQTSPDHLSSSGADPPPETSTSRPSPPVDRPLVRRSYHPNPPAHRSEWVMWTGNVPSDATHDELWRFFNQPPESGSESPPSTGVLSIFLILRSSCAFVNFEAEHHLLKAIERFNGQALRPSDARCPRLVCRVRKKDDDLKAGVGGQRGIGIHARWIKEQKGRVMESSDVSDVSDRPSSASSGQMPEAAMSSLSISSDDDPRQRRAKQSSSSGSFASTNSSLLTCHFPQRYFILKSLTQFDLDLSVEKGLWATQKHNEGILDQAFRTSQDVYLIFSVNKSGEFYGYAKMAGPIQRDSPSKLKSGNLFFTPGVHLVDESPLPVSAGGESRKQDAGPTGFNPGLQHRQTAPAELGAPRHQMTMATPMVKHSLDQQLRRSPKGSPSTPPDNFELDVSAPIRAIRSGSSSDVQEHQAAAMSNLQAVAEEDEKGEDNVQVSDKVGPSNRHGMFCEGKSARDDWGESFKIEWLSTVKLPFPRTRHIRNPWNHDREVKVSRDGTEVEPMMGKRLLEEWTRLADVQSPKVAAHKRGLKSAPMLTGAALSKQTGTGPPPERPVS